VSNRRIAAQLDVSEGTVRSRIRRMEDEKLIRIQAVSDPFAFGFTSHAYVGIETVGGKVDDVANALLGVESVFVLTRTLGEFDLLAVVATADRESLIDTILHRIRPLPGIRRTETFENWAALKHAYLWARLV
jgi:DNA-binding Lrp family transcriptional regulator